MSIDVTTTPVHVSGLAWITVTEGANGPVIARPMIARAAGPHELYIVMRERTVVITVGERVQLRGGGEEVVVTDEHGSFKLLLPHVYSIQDADENVLVL